MPPNKRTNVPNLHENPLDKVYEHDEITQLRQQVEMLMQQLAVPMAQQRGNQLADCKKGSQKGVFVESNEGVREQKVDLKIELVFDNTGVAEEEYLTGDLGPLLMAHHRCLKFNQEQDMDFDSDPIYDGSTPIQVNPSTSTAVSNPSIFQGPTPPTTDQVREATASVPKLPTQQDGKTEDLVEATTELVEGGVVLATPGAKQITKGGETGGANTKRGYANCTQKAAIRKKSSKLQKNRVLDQIAC
ncbi:hypothetical protein LWI28_000001 [Acer negundo]|uniref:Uncharacterized protein n=1 Tax=Acer negundo TaxID=4023 RepID=A0AAD5NCY7_ACENE|nr:hypothetical protein LWI28_000001 [Acer negundo]